MRLKPRLKGDLVHDRGWHTPGTVDVFSFSVSRVLILSVTPTALSKMAFCEGSWGAAYWVLLLLIATFNSLVQAGNVVHLTVDWKQPPPGAVQNELLRRLNARSYLQAFMYNNRSTAAYGAYMVNVTIGTPGQPVSLAIELGWSDTIVLATTAYECNQKSWTDGDGPCYGGTC